MTTAPAWLADLPFAPAPSAHVMGTRALAPGDWLRADQGDADVIRSRRAIFDHHTDDVTGRVVGFEPQLDAAARAIAAAVAAGEQLPLEDVARYTAEDVCVLARTSGGWVLVGGVVCFPSMWRLPDKLGRSLVAVHEPVPRYVEELAARVDRFLDRLAEGRPVWRRNWFVHDTPELFLPASPASPTPPASVALAPDVDVPGDLWLRSERQTLARVNADVIVFTIRTQQAPLEVVAARPDIAARMHAAVVSWPDEIVQYRGATRWRAALGEWLASIAADD